MESRWAVSTQTLAPLPICRSLPSIRQHELQRGVCQTWALKWSLQQPACKPQLHARPLRGQMSKRRLTSHFVVSAQKSDLSQQRHEDGGDKAGLPKMAVCIAAVVGFGVANRVLYKQALVPMGNYVFFLAQAQTFGYILVYWTFLLARKKAGKITDEMLALPKKQFLVIGALEACSALLGFIGAAKLPGVALPLFQQSIMFWQIGMSYLLLGKRFTAQQLAGAATVVGGVCLAAWPSQGGGVLQEAQPVYVGIFVASMLFPALGSIFKEKIFKREKERLKGQELDIFVVNSYGSTAQALFVLLLLPLMVKQRGIALTQLPTYFSEGVQTFLGANPGVVGAPLLPLLYIACNLGFNISALTLLRTAGNVVQSLCMSSLTPLTILAFSQHLPYLPAPPQLKANFWWGTAVLISGLALYNAQQWLPMLGIGSGKQEPKPKAA